MEINRYKNPFEHTRIFYCFKNHHTQLNDMYWSLVPVFHYAMCMERKAESEETVATIFKATGPDVRRVTNNRNIWKRNFSEARSWNRLTCLLGALGYLETFVKSIITLALRSDPGVMYKRPRAIEGTSWMKIGISPDHGKLLESVTKGEWPSRMATYKELFGSVPSAVMGHLGELEKLRVLRNGAGHAFGRNASFSFLMDNKVPDSIARISEDKLKKALATIEDVAVGIDAHLGDDFIGSFEVIESYHIWRSSKAAVLANFHDEDRKFKKACSEIFRTPISIEYSRQVIEFYKAA